MPLPPRSKEHRQKLREAALAMWADKEFRQRQIFLCPRGPTHPRWKGGKPHCAECGVEIGYESMYCRKCARKGERSGNWKGGKPRCAECGIEINYRSTYCKEHWSGSNHPFWKGGISDYWDTPEYQVWRIVVFERDDYTCQECGAKGVYLHSHHKKPVSEYPELVYDIDNGQTLCIECHAEKHPELYHLIMAGAQQ